MWLNCSHVIVNPEKVSKVVEILQGEAGLEPIQAARGFCGLYLVESTETPGELVSITVWESAEDGQAYLASPECREVVNALQGYLRQPLERHYYQVQIETSKQQVSLAG